MESRVQIGVLALQGAFLEHQNMFSKLGIETFQIRKRQDLNRMMDGLVLPGGESTAVNKLLLELDMLNCLQYKIKMGLPVLGTCAGLILLSKEIRGQKSTALATMDIECVRNAYGRQLGSFKANSKFANFENIPMVFIRAPYISRVGENVKILAEVDGKVVAARQRNQLVTAFHPELTHDIRIHSYFLDNVIKRS